MRLSSAARLAKDPKPSFIYVLRTDAQQEFIEAYLIHFLDDNLSKILRRLRAEHNSSHGNTENINRKFIDFYPTRDGRAIALSGGALRAEIASQCEGRVPSYVEIKQNQLRLLGFGSRPYQMEMTISAADARDFVDVMLGLKDVAVSNLLVSEERFGIVLPMPEMSSETAKISVKPNAADSCIITLHGSDHGDFISFSGDVFVPAIPGLAPQNRKILIDSSLFTLTLTDSEIDITIKTFDLDHAEKRMDGWVEFFKLQWFLSNESTVLTLKFSQAPVTMHPLTGTVISWNAGFVSHMLEACQGVNKLLTLAGVSQTLFLLVQIESELQNLVRLSRLIALKSTTSWARIKTEKVASIPLRTKTKMLYVDFIEIGPHIIAYYCVSDVTIARKFDHTLWNFWAGRIAKSTHREGNIS